MNKLKNLFKFIKVQIAETGLNSKWVGLVSVAVTVGLAALLVALFK